VERAVLDENRCERALPRIERCFEHGPLRLPVGIGFEIEQFSLEENLLEQVVDVRAFFGGDRRGERGAPELFEHDAVRQEILFHLLHIGSRQIDLVDRDDERHAGVLGVRDRFNRLRHDRVVGSDDQHDDVGHLRAARAHGGERFVARRIEEGDPAAVFQCDLIGADVLRDAPRFARDDVRLADVIEERRLPVVDVTHDRHDRRPGLQRLGGVGGLFGLRRRVFLFAHGLEPERGRDELDHVEVEPLVDRHHLAELFERERHDLGGRHLERVGELGDRDELGHAHQRLLALALFAPALFLDLAEGGALLAAVDALLADRRLQRRERARDVLRDRFLIDERLLPLLAFLPLFATTLIERRCPRCRGGDWTRRYGATRS
jgi:hypothetical protein